ncbi:hypothetical protein M2451_001048 [Dysgonomonas sp. PFB1-18]|nr:hypothetical protein [Dysgonomonas sp. PF1-14]MDH6338234.1 hypothetical protein [Dysgonomonas sp. PF1-16]MDH6379731.1 hypothetical protein [Dysgonomonas sp. PFB1-18]MDH6397179.1 hypothetical protein [Dysgonomonas sp. PF1-23]
MEDELLSITQICKDLHIGRQAFYNWMEDKKGFKEMVKSAMERRDETLMATVYSSIKRKLEGYTTVIEKDIYVPDMDNTTNLIFKQKVIIKKEYQPDLKTIKMLLDRNDKKKAALSPTPVKSRKRDFT